MLTKDQEVKKAEAEAKMLTMINLIANNYYCKVVNIDCANRVIKISGTKETEHDCAVAIGDYIESAGGELF